MSLFFRYNILLLTCIAALIHAQPIEQQWVLLGTPINHDAIQAISLDFDNLNMMLPTSPTLGNSLPVLAYGYYNATTGGSSINFIHYQPVTMNEPIINNQSLQGQWNIIATHTPQFAQPYDNFNFKIRDNGILYLGLRIDESDFMLSSILKGERGIGKTFEGCYAFNGYIFDYDINFLEPNTGDIKLITSPDNLTLAYSTYGHTGYNSYPAGDTWGPYIPITPSLPSNQYSIDNIMVISQFSMNELKVFFAYDQIGNTTIGQVSLLNNTNYLPYTNNPLSGNLVGLSYTAWSYNISTGLLCVALELDNSNIIGGGNINIQCLIDNNENIGIWSNIGTALQNISKHDEGMGVPIGFTMFQYNTSHIAIMVSGVDMNNNTLIKSSWNLCTVINTSLQCNTNWNVGPTIQTQQVINNLQLSSPTVWQGGGLHNVLMSNTVVLVVSEGIGQNGQGDTLSIYGMLI